MARAPGAPCACGTRKPAWRAQCFGCRPRTNRGRQPRVIIAIADTHVGDLDAARQATRQRALAWQVCTCLACGERSDAVAIGNRLFAVTNRQASPIHVRLVGRFPSPGLRCARCHGTVEIAPVTKGDVAA